MHSDRPIIFLKPGEIHFARNPAKVITVLGSCISVIMHCRSRNMGAICHAVLPSASSSGKPRSRIRDPFQYVDKSIEWMISQFNQLKVDMDSVEVKIYGGAEMMAQKEISRPIAVGRNNIEAAIQIIEENNLKIKAWNVGGNKGRKLIFYTDTGDVITNYVGRQIFTPRELIYGVPVKEENAGSEGEITANLVSSGSGIGKLTGIKRHPAN